MHTLWRWTDSSAPGQGLGSGDCCPRERRATSTSTTWRRGRQLQEGQEQEGRVCAQVQLPGEVLAPDRHGSGHECCEKNWNEQVIWHGVGREQKRQKICWRYSGALNLLCRVDVWNSDLSEIRTNGCPDFRHKITQPRLRLLELWQKCLDFRQLF